VIVSASYRTDIPAFHGRWFLGRLAAGSCRVANPYGGPDRTVRLDRGAVDGFVFWTRNPAPFAEALAAVHRRGDPFVVQQTVTGYPRGLDAATPTAAQGVAALRAVSKHYGRRAAVWRYDPIAVTDSTPAAWHRENFARLAGLLSGAVDEAVVSFLQVYRKTRRNLDRAAQANGFSWRDPDDGEKAALLADLAAIAADHGIRLTVCGQPSLLGGTVGEARCIDAARLSDVAGRDIAAADKPHRAGCACARSTDIGAYDTCPHCCVYCYAVTDRERAKQRIATLDPAADSLSPIKAARR
jgi:hypothetical protein